MIQQVGSSLKAVQKAGQQTMAAENNTNDMLQWLVSEDSRQIKNLIKRLLSKNYGELSDHITPSDMETSIIKR